ncbi:MAG: O-antigen ligase family protein [Clostridia bacterium]|nr:O-antigen ligase family protein [Clostridia bacterium]
MLQKFQKLFQNPWFIAWLVLPFIKPATEFTGKFDLIFDLLKILHCGIILLGYRFIQKKPSAMILLIGGLQAIFLAATCLKGGMIWWGAVQVLSILSLCALLEMTLRLDRKAALQGFGISLGLMGLATVITMFACYPEGLYTVVTEHEIEGLWHLPETNNFLWGFDNASAFKFIPAMILFLLNTDPKSKKSKIFTFALLFLITAAFIYVRAIMALLGALLILVYFVVLFQRNQVEKLLSVKTCVIAVCIIAVLLIGVNKNLPFLQTIADHTEKTASLNHRVKVWGNTIEESLASPLIGHGFEERMVTAKKLGIDHPHNVFLDVLYRGGLSACLFYGLMLILACKKTFKARKTLFGNILAIGFLAFLLMAQMDYYNDQYLPFLLFILADHTDLFIFDSKKALPFKEA